jgi:hypothetical protein
VVSIFANIRARFSRCPTEVTGVLARTFAPIRCRGFSWVGPVSLKPFGDIRPEPIAFTNEPQSEKDIYRLIFWQRTSSQCAVENEASLPRLRRGRGWQ